MKMDLTKMNFPTQEQYLALLTQLHKDGGEILLRADSYQLRGEGNHLEVEIVPPAEALVHGVQAYFCGEKMDAQTIYIPEKEGWQEYRLVLRESEKEKGWFEWVYEKRRYLTTLELAQELTELKEKWGWAAALKLVSQLVPRSETVWKEAKALYFLEPEILKKIEEKLFYPRIIISPIG
jgi:hypothetical protein